MAGTTKTTKDKTTEAGAVITGYGYNPTYVAELPVETTAA
jgi:hypothetical protein